jgi:CDP-diacylglycerol--glycerol-3-phosphate 3-phosphatidyltransferase
MFAAISDFFDGWLARKNDEETEIGRILDPIADKLLVILTLIPLMSNFDGLLILSSILIIFREIFISGLRENLNSEKIILKVTLLSKWKTAIQLIAISNCLIHISLKHLEANQPILNFIFEISWFLSYLIIPAALLSLLTGFKYLKKVSSFYIKENS